MRLSRSTLALHAMIGTLIACRIAGAASGVLTNLVMARIMSTDQMGIALTAMSVAVLGALVASGRLEAGGVRFLAGYLATGRRDAVRGYLRFTTGGAWRISVGASVLALSGLWIYAAVSGADPSLPFMLAVPAAAMLGITRVWASHALGFARPIAATAPLQLARPFALMAGMYAWAGTLGPLGATEAMLIFLASVVAALLLQALLVQASRRAVGPGPADLSDRRAWIRVGLGLGLTAVFIEFGRDLAIVFAGMTLPPDDIARFGVAIRIVGFVKFGLVAVNQSFMPQLAAAMAIEDGSEVTRKIALSNHIKFWPMLVSFALVLVAGEALLRVFGPEFVAAAPVLPILMIEPLALAMLGPASNFIAFSRSPHILLPVTLVAVGLLAVGVVGGGRLAGMEGAAWGIAGAWMFWSVALALYARMRLGRDVTMIAGARWLLGKLGFSGPSE